jgi:hypothetical protein
MVEFLTQSLEQMDAAIFRGEIRLSVLLQEAAFGSNASSRTAKRVARVVQHSLAVYWVRRQQLFRAAEAVELASHAVQAVTVSANERTGASTARGKVFSRARVGPLPTRTA